MGSCEKLIFKAYDPQEIMNRKEIIESLGLDSIYGLNDYITKKKNQDPTRLFILNSEPRK